VQNLYYSLQTLFLKTVFSLFFAFSGLPKECNIKMFREEVVKFLMHSLDLVTE